MFRRWRERERRRKRELAKAATEQARDEIAELAKPDSELVKAMREHHLKVVRELGL